MRLILSNILKHYLVLPETRDLNLGVVHFQFTPPSKLNTFSLFGLFTLSLGLTNICETFSFPIVTYCYIFITLKVYVTYLLNLLFLHYVNNFYAKTSQFLHIFSLLYKP